MKCKNCGNYVEENAKFCPDCGAVIESATAEAAAPVVPEAHTEPQAPVTPSPSLTREEFFKAYADKKLKSNYTATMVICFITAGVSVPLIALGYLSAIFDLIFFLIIGIIMTKKKAMVFPLLVSIVGGIGTVISLASGGTPSGIVALVIAISTVVGMKKFNKQYTDYKAGNFNPEEAANK